MPAEAAASSPRGNVSERLRFRLAPMGRASRTRLRTATVLAALLAGCSTGGQAMDDPREAASELRPRPTSEAEVARLEQLRQEIRDQLSSELGRSTFSDLDGSAAGCADFSGQKVVLQGARESLLRFGTGTGSANATLQLETGCHLPAAVRDAG